MKTTVKNADSSSTNSFVSQIYYRPSFGGASDITVKYVYNTSAELLPPSVLKKIGTLTESLGDTNLNMLLKDFHKLVYEKLFSAKTLAEAKSLYPEFADVKEATVLDGIKSKAVDVIKEKSSLEEFTLEYLKKLYAPTTLTKIAEEYGFTNVSVLNWLNTKLNIPKLKGNYLMLLKMSDDAENAKVTNFLRQVIPTDPEAEKKRIESIIKTTQTQEYRKKQSLIINHHKSHPEISNATTYVNNRMWKLCPQVKEKLHEFACSNKDFAAILRKMEFGETLTDEENSLLNYLRKLFWQNHPECRKDLSVARKKAYEEYRNLK